MNIIRRPRKRGEAPPHPEYRLGPEAKEAARKALLDKVGAEATLHIQKRIIAINQRKIKADPSLVLRTVKMAVNRMNKFKQRAASIREPKMKAALIEASHEWEGIAIKASTIFIRDHQTKRAADMRARVIKKDSHHGAGQMRQIAKKFNEKAREEINNQILHDMYQQASHIWSENAAAVEQYAYRSHKK